MDATAKNLFEIAASDEAQAIPSRAATREAMEDTYKAVAATVIALNYAHHRELGENDKGDRHRSELGSPFTFTLTNTMPPAGMYDTFFHMYAEDDGFVINTFTNARFDEPMFELRIGADGRMNYSTFNRGGIPVRFDTVESPAKAQMLFGKWMMRNFDAETLARAQSWLPKVIEHLRLRHPSHPGAWESPFGHGKVSRRLTA